MKQNRVGLLACCGVEIIVKDHCEFEESNDDKEHQEYSGEDFDIIG